MENKQYFIGVDIGGTNIKIAVIDNEGNHFCLIRFFNRGIELTKEKYFNFLLNKIIKIQKKGKRTISGIGISLPGLQMTDGSGTLYSVNLPLLNGFNIKKFFFENVHLPISVTNDLVSHSLGEYQFGSGKGVERFLSVSLGTGIGHTFIVNGKPLIIINGISGDSGRMILDPVSNLCDSGGVIGSAEALCGVKAIEYLVEEKKLKHKFYYTSDVIAAARERNDPEAREILSIISRRVAQLLVNLASIFSPELISLTGGQVEAGDFFIIECQKEFNRLSSNFFNHYFQAIGKEKSVQIVKAKAGGLAGLLGSIVPLLQYHLNEK